VDLPRDVPVGNDHFLIMFNSNYQITDIYYPFVGKENHALGHPCRFGVFVDGRFSWTNDWDKSVNYLQDTLVTDATLRNKDLQVEVNFNDAVDFVVNVLVRKVTVRNLKRDSEREIRLFFHQDFHISGTDIGDTGFYDPVKTKAVIHYKANRYFLANLLTEKGEGIHQYAIGVKEIGGREGTWRDAEDGYLGGNPIAQGAVDSVISAELNLPSGGESYCYYWLVAGQTYDEVRRRDFFVKDRTPATLLKRTSDYWKLWSKKEDYDPDGLSDKIWKQYTRSLMIIKTQIDGNGAIIAANDTDILRFNKDTYSYMWPRDGAFTAMALDDSGYADIAGKFYEFSNRVILPEGWFYHKYQPDGSAGSSWHPWISGTKTQLPIQEDETALVVYALWNHFVKYRDVDFVKPFYKPLVKRAADFMVEYRDSITKLPLPSYDLWEEPRGVHTFTSSTVYAGLLAAASFARAFGESELDLTYRNAAEEVKQAILANLFDKRANRFLKKVDMDEGVVSNPDATVDSSLAGVFLFGVLEPDDPRVVSTMQAVEDECKVRTKVGGIARYQKDRYQAINDYSDDIPGNPWFICTLWVADWYIGKAKVLADLDPAKGILDWVVSHTLPSGVMAEQLNPYDGSPLSVSPLTWSHAAFVDTVNRFVKKRKLLGVG
jgi:glucoamylase